MRWEEGRESDNVEDQRGFPISGRGAGLGCGGLILLLVISWITGINPLRLLDSVQQAPQAPPPPSSSARSSGPPKDTLGKFASVVLASTEDVWKDIFARNGRTYVEPKLVLFTGATRSGCGTANAQVGPFYCQVDRKVYLDLSFFRELSQRFGAPGEFADAYVVAHEVGHHVQNALGSSTATAATATRSTSVRDRAPGRLLRRRLGQPRRQGSRMIEPGDFEEGLQAAAAIGDDRLQRLGQGYVQPESFTHGSSQDRVAWLRRGLTAGDPGQCDTFGRSR